MPEDIGRQLADIREPLGNGNVRVSLARCLTAIIAQPIAVYQSRLIGEFNTIVARSGRDLTKMELDALNASVREMPEDVRKRLELLPGSGAHGGSGAVAPGRVNGLFVVEAREPYGCMGPVQVTILTGDRAKFRNIFFTNTTGDLDVSLAVTGAGIAVQKLLENNGLSPRGRGAFSACDIYIEIGQIMGCVRGRSLGLPVAMALVSGLTGVSVDPKVAFSGRVEGPGTICAVDGIKEKLDAAADKEMETVYLPEGNRRTVPSEHAHRVCHVSRLDEVVEMIVGRHAISALIESLNASSVAAAEAMEKEERRAKGSIRILFSSVGNRDPYGDPKFQPMTQGSLLTAYRRVRPHAICLLDNPYLEDKEAGQRCERELKAIDPTAIVQTRTLQITDPTDYDQLWAEMSGEATAFLTMVGKRLGCTSDQLDYYVNLSSGTSQIHAVWLELLRKGILHGGHPLQVREPRYIASGEARVREVWSRHLGFGMIPNA